MASIPARTLWKKFLKLKITFKFLLLGTTTRHKQHDKSTKEACSMLVAGALVEAVCRMHSAKG